MSVRSFQTRFGVEPRVPFHDQKNKGTNKSVSYENRAYNEVARTASQIYLSALQRYFIGSFFFALETETGTAVVVVAVPLGVRVHPTP